MWRSGANTFGRLAKMINSVMRATGTQDIGGTCPGHVPPDIWDTPDTPLRGVVSGVSRGMSGARPSRLPRILGRKLFGHEEATPRPVLPNRRTLDDSAGAQHYERIDCAS